jgi:hypothetical protein
VLTEDGPSLGSVSGHAARAVLFVDGGAIVPFVQLAVALRRWGYRTIRVTSARRSIGSWYTGRLAFDRVLYLEQSELGDLEAALHGEHLVDVQCAEHLAEDVYRSLERSTSTTGGTGWHNRGGLIDKWEVARWLDEIGIDHPRSVLGSTAPDEAARTLGLPIVVKPRIGVNGHGVFVAHSLGDLEGHVSGLRRDELLFEAFIDGTPVNYCAVVGDGAERDMTYRTVRRGAEAWSPSIEIVCYRDDELTQVGRRLAAALPSQGLVNVDAIRDAEGRYQVHDVNLRVWGAFFASWNAGFDLTGAYLRWLSDQVRQSMGDGERPALVFPDYAGVALLADRRSVGLHDLLGQVRDYRRLLGRGYVLREAARWARSFVLGERTNTGAERRRPGRSE